MSMSYHPQIDGQTECANHNIGQIFCMIVCNNQKDWVDRIDLMEFAINASVSGTTKYITLKPNSGYIPSMIGEIHSDDVIPKE